MKKKPPFIKLNRTEDTELLIKTNPNAFILLTVIAMRARREPNFINDLDVCESFIGDYREYGLTRQTYRTALKQLTDNQLITINATKAGTVVKLICSNIYDINIIESNQVDNQKITTKQPTANQGLTINKNVKKEITKELNNIEFEKFWTMYDKKVGSKPKCCKKFYSLKTTDHAIIFKTLQAYKANTPDKTFRKNPMTYLNNESWNDEIITNIYNLNQHQPGTRIKTDEEMNAK